MQLSPRTARRAVGALTVAHLVGAALLTSAPVVRANATVPAVRADLAVPVVPGLLAGPTLATGPVPRPVARGVWPLQPRPRVVSGFDPPSRPWASGHRGVDLAGRLGQPVLAALAGRVTFAGRLAGRGVVVVDHGATRTTYEPVRATVSVGDPVGAGAMLGTLELFGSHCFPAVCLHWGLIADGGAGGAGKRYLDPLTLVGAVPVRLLPLR
jgi:murein DD-endopeptidase MepM/ murein hydrolase activator NlpD